MRRTAPLLLALVLAVIGVPLVAASPASASVTLGGGTVLYRKGVDVYATDGTTTRRITTNGGTHAADGTGTTGYLYPSESNDGSVLVTARNQDEVASDSQHYLRGFLWVMDAYGHVIRKINPPQYAYNGGTTCGMPNNAPQGIANAHVSPDGKHIAYTISELIEVWGIYGCYVDTAYRTTVIGIDGTNAVPVDDGSGTSTMNESLDTGSWVDNSTLLVDRGDFGSVEVYRASLPNLSGTAWFGPDSYTDTAYLQPALRNGVLVTSGLSDATSQHAVRVWRSSGFGAAPTYHCEAGSTVATDDGLYDMSLSPDGSQVAYEDANSDDSTTKPGQGVYVMDTSTCATAELAEGAIDPFWTPAGINPPRDTTAPTATLAAPPAVLTATSTTLHWTGQDTGTGIAGYQVQQRRGTYGQGLGVWSNVGTGTTATSKALTGLVPGATYCFRVVATDGAGNVGTSPQRCTVVALDDRALTRSAGWTLGSGSGYYLGTTTSGTSKGATLTRAADLLDQVGVVATTCPTCGTIGVYAGSALIGNVNLATSTTHYRVVRMLPRFTRRSATVTLRVLTSGKRVSIDGLVGTSN